MSTDRRDGHPDRLRLRPQPLARRVDPRRPGRHGPLPRPRGGRPARQSLPTSAPTCTPLGVLLFECLAGRPPFHRRHRRRTAPAAPVDAGPRPREQERRPPRPRRASCERLLRKDPAERYQSAAALAYDLDVGPGRRSTPATPTRAGHRPPRPARRPSPTRRSSGAEPNWPACSPWSATHRPTAAAGWCCWRPTPAAARAGCSPRSRKQAARPDVTGPARPGRAAGRPAAVHPAARRRPRTWSPWLTPTAASRRGCRPASVTRAPAVARALPALAPLLGAPRSDDTGPEQFGEQRSLAALRQLLHAVAALAQPVLHRARRLPVGRSADGPAARRRPSATRRRAALRHVGVVAAFRSEEVAADHPLRHIRRGAAVHLGPLSGAVDDPARRVDGRARCRSRRSAPSCDWPTAARSWARPCCADSSSPAPWSARPTVGQVEDRADGRTSRPLGGQRVPRPAARAARRRRPRGAVSRRGARQGVRHRARPSASPARPRSPRPASSRRPARRRLLWVDERTGRCSFFHDKIRESLLDRLGRRGAARPAQPGGRRAARRRARRRHRCSTSPTTSTRPAGSRPACPYAMRAAEASPRPSTASTRPSRTTGWPQRGAGARRRGRPGGDRRGAGRRAHAARRLRARRRRSSSRRSTLIPRPRSSKAALGGQARRPGLQAGRRRRPRVGTSRGP